jgi:DNA replication protein DnaC
MQAKLRLLRLLDLSFLATGTNIVLIGNPGVGKTFLAKVIAWRASKPISACCSPPLWTCSIICLLPRSIIPW